MSYLIYLFTPNHSINLLQRLRNSSAQTNRESIKPVYDWLSNNNIWYKVKEEMSFMTVMYLSSEEDMIKIKLMFPDIVKHHG